MAAECAHVYKTGHRCRRIPARGQTLCRDHRVPPRPSPAQAEAAFDREMSFWLADPHRLQMLMCPAPAPF